jgi:hypothetical protein
LIEKVFGRTSWASAALQATNPVLEVLQYTSGRLHAQALHLRQDCSLKKDLVGFDFLGDTKRDKKN